MSKYIDADKLKKYIEHKRNCVCDGLDWEDMDECQRYAVEYLDDILAYIESLQQEQLVNKDLGTLIACDIIEMTVKKAIDKPQDKEKEEELMTRKINYLRSLEENYVQQEQQEQQEQQVQPEVDLEEYIENEINHYGLSLYKASYGTFSASEIDRIIRNAFEFGLNARKEE